MYLLMLIWILAVASVSATKTEDSMPYVFCYSYTDCPPGMMCENNECIISLGEPCQSDWECSLGLICLSRVCEFGHGMCNSDWNCPPGLMCIRERCQWGEGRCNSDWNCDPGLRCIDGVCQHGQGKCNSDWNCDVGLLCVDGVCGNYKSVTACNSDWNCDVGTMCVQDKCIDGDTAGLECSSLWNCKPGATACLNGQCVF